MVYSLTLFVSTSLLNSLVQIFGVSKLSSLSTHRALFAGQQSCWEIPNT